MYDLPELRSATESWWRGLSGWMRRLGLIGVPDTLVRPTDRYANWLDPSLLLSQTCGYPLTHRLRGKVRLVATPCYRAQGCEGATYRSAIICRDRLSDGGLSQFRGKRAAINDYDSQSGWNVLRYSFRQFGAVDRFFGEITVTGAHRRSLAAVREGAADVAAIDCVTFELLRHLAPEELNGIAIVAWSDSAPALPYITNADADPNVLASLRDALQAASTDPSLAGIRGQLLIDGFSVLPIESYNVILQQEAQSDNALSA